MNGFRREGVDGCQHLLKTIDTAQIVIGLQLRGYGIRRLMTRIW